MDKYHVRLFRDGEATGYTICAIRIRARLFYELWHQEGREQPVCLGRDDSADVLKKQAKEFQK